MKRIPGLALLTDIIYLPYGHSKMAYLSFNNMEASIPGIGDKIRIE
ncbi:hypothetical protein [Paenibacillus sp. 37]|nr:hypothetical protein [Paenibacillus sp. 37]